MERGTYKFDVTKDGDLTNTAANVELLRKLWLDRLVIKGDDLGPGDPGDFDHGAWHVACHLAGGCGVRQRPDGSLAWLQISHDQRADRYFASVTVLEGLNARTVPTESAEGRILLRQSRLLGFIEGTSKGRTSARFTNDPPTLFNLWRRQDFDLPPRTDEDGGRVWEHWCTLRDIRPSHAIGTSVLTAFVALTAALGDPDGRPWPPRIRPSKAIESDGRRGAHRSQVSGLGRHAYGDSIELRSRARRSGPGNVVEGCNFLRLVEAAPLLHVCAKDRRLEQGRRR